MFYICTKKNRQLDRIERILFDIHSHMSDHQQETYQMALDLTLLAEQVARLETVEASAVTLLHELLNEIAVLKDDPAALMALVDRVKGSVDDLAAAVLEGTPTEPTPVVEPPVVETPVVEVPVVEETPVVEAPVVEETPVVEPPVE